MPSTDFNQHNAEVRAVWDAFRRREPIRVPMILGINPRYTMFHHEANPRGVTFAQYMSDPQVMLERQLEHQHWVRHHVPQDAEMGLPADGWVVNVDFQNTYEAAWLGCRLHFYDDQVPDTAPFLNDEETKRSLFDAGLPDPFNDGIMRQNWQFYDYFKQKQAEGWTFHRLPIKAVNPCGLGTDGPVTIACNIRGASEFMTDLLADTSYAMQLLDFIVSATIKRIRAYREKLGLPLKPTEWGFADDSIQLVSLQTYKELIFPHHHRLVDALAGGGPHGVHLCGDATRHYRFLRDTLNVQSFDTGFPVDFGWLREQLGPGVQIQGGPSVPFLRLATPAAVREEVQRILGSGIMAGGRFILREGNNLAPGVPLENLQAMYAAVREFGKY